MKNRCSTLIARENMDIIPEQPFHILVSSVFERWVRLPKHIIIAECEASSDVTRAVNVNDQNTFPIETAGIDNNCSNTSAEIHSSVF